MKKAGASLRNWLLAGSLSLGCSWPAQITNYVTNGGFEQYISCTGPNTGYLKPNVPGWDEIGSDAVGKWNHTCYGAIPGNGFFYNFPKSNSAYISFDVYCLTCAPNLRR